MNRIIVVVFALLLGGCYTQLQIPDKETAYTPSYVPPEPPIVIFVPQPYPPAPCPEPRPDPPAHPVIGQPAQQPAPSSEDNNRIRTNGATRDEPGNRRR